MHISLSKQSEVSLRQQLAEQIVFLITTGKLRPGERLPSVRAMARRVKVHHNTVSEAYQDLVRRKWLSRRKGSRLVVRGRGGPTGQSPANLDELINDAIQRARDMGFTLRALTERVRERILLESPDHILVVGEEPGLCEIIRKEVAEALRFPVKVCTPEQLKNDPALVIGAQVLAPNFVLEDLGALIPANRPGLPVVYSGADQHLAFIRELEHPSIVAAVSVSQSVLNTARGLFAPAIGRRHTFRSFCVSDRHRVDLRSADLVFCDSIALPAVNCRQKVLYRLVDPACLELLATVIKPPPVS